MFALSLLITSAVLAACATSGEAEPPSSAPVTARGNPSVSVPPQPPGTYPRVVEVTCTHTGAVLSSRAVEASPDGVHVKVANGAGTDWAGTTWSYVEEGITQTTAADIIAAPPGQLSVTCLSKTGARSVVKITVEDPHHYYRPMALTSLGCQRSGWQRSASFTPSDTGISPSDAIAHYMQGHGLTHSTYRKLDMGYVDDPVYLLFTDGKPVNQLLVGQVSWDKRSYYAVPGQDCLT